jgi:predicted CopG family antitoxin
LPSISTFRGMQIDFNEQFWKQESSIRVSRESFSKVINSTYDRKKHNLPSISIFRGM